MTLGDILKKYREENHMSMDEFSRRSTLSKGYISMLENNINPRSSKPIAPTLPTIKKAAYGMNTDVDVILKLLNDGQELSLAEDANTMSEYDLIKKYRSLDVYGKQLINLVLEAEYKRCIVQAAVTYNKEDTIDQSAISEAMKKIGQDIQSRAEDIPNILVINEIGEDAFKKGSKSRARQKEK